MKHPLDNYLDLPKSSLIVLLRSRDEALHEMARKVLPMKIENERMKQRLALIEQHRAMFQEAK
jgi:hypothetical protein